MLTVSKKNLLNNSAFEQVVEGQFFLGDLQGKIGLDYQEDFKLT